MPSLSGMIVYMHVGAPKTGTTFVQHLLRRNKRALANDGVCYPGERRQSHYWAALDLRETTFKNYPDPNISGAWPRLVEQIRRWDGPAAIIDHELFGRATPEHIDRALSDLSFADVHVIYSVRDLARQLPAAWQEKIKNGATLSFADFLDSVRYPGDGPSAGQHFWEAHDFAQVLERWAGALPPDRVHVVTVPPPGTSDSSLWERFAAAAGLDPDRYHTEGLKTNASLGAAEAGALRKLNLAADDKNIDWPAYAGSVKGLLGHHVLADRPGRHPIELPVEDYSWVRAHAQETVRTLKDARYNVVGDLTDLLPSGPSEVHSAASVDGVPVEEQLDAAAEAMAALLERITRLRQRAERAENRAQALKGRRNRALARAQRAENRAQALRGRRGQALARAQRIERRVAEHAELTPAERIKRTVVELGGQVPAVGNALQLYRRVKRFAGRR